MIKGLVIGLLLGLALSAYADRISAPPPMSSDPALQHYLQEIYVNLHRLEVVSSIPDTTRSGKKGDMVLYISGATYRLYINVDSGTSWKYAALS